MKKIPLMRIFKAFMLMILINVICLPIANAQFGWEQVVGDLTGGGGGNGFGDENNDGVSSMAVFRGYLYVGTYRSTGCEVWRSSDGTTWEQVDTGGFAETDPGRRGEPGDTNSHRDRR